jgi:hypothetical protein
MLGETLAFRQAQGGIKINHGWHEKRGGGTGRNEGAADTPAMPERYRASQWMEYTSS